MKKSLLIFTLLAATAAVAFAEPDIGVTFKQGIEAYYEGNHPDPEESILLITEFKATAKYSFDAVYVTPWLKGKAEVQGTELDVFPYIGLDMGYTLSEALTIGLNNEFYFQADASATRTENEWTPKLYAEGAVADLEYAVEVGPEFTFKGSEEGDNTIDIEAALELVYGLPVDAVGISVILSDEFDYSLETPSDSKDAEIENDAELIFEFDLNGFTPYIGYSNEFAFGQEGEDSYESQKMFNGVRVGAAMKKDNWSVGLDYQYGYESEREDTTAAVEVWVKCKI